MEKKDKLLQKQNERYVQFKEIPRSYVEMDEQIERIGGKDR